MSKDATEQLAIVRSFLVSPELVVAGEVHDYRVGDSLPNLQSSAEYRRAFIHDITIAISPRQPINFEQRELNHFFNETIGLRGSQRYYDGGIGHHNGEPYYLPTMVGTHWLYGETGKTVTLQQQVKIEDEDLKAEVSSHQIKLVTKQELPVQQSITLYELPNQELAKLWADIASIPYSEQLFPNFKFGNITREQIQMIHEGHDPFADIKRKVAALKGT